MGPATGWDAERRQLQQLRGEYPRWRIWWGQATGHYWAMPPPGHPTQYDLISAPDLDELAQRLAAAEGRPKA